MKPKVDYTLYLCTDRGLMTTDTVEESVELAIDGGCTVIQLREKQCSSRDFYELALRVKGITARRGVPLILHARVANCLAAGADGGHVGQSDLPACQVRRLLGPDRILGVSARTLEEALEAQENGADYLGVGAMYATSTKTDAQVVSMETLRAIRGAVQIPIVVIGGINRDTLEPFRGMGIDGLAVVSAVVAQQDIRAAARELVERFKEG